MRTRLFLMALCAAPSVACLDAAQCVETEDSARDALPARLSAAGLYDDVENELLADGVRPYAPRFELESDGADKRRWVSLPRFFQIDTADMDAWQFPEGTRFFKEFARDGVRVETRVMLKTGAGAADWVMGAYEWNDEETDASLRVEGHENARGTAHDIPSSTTCTGCHGGTRARVLGFSAVQLPARVDGPSLDLDTLVREGLLTEPPSEAFAIPGDETEQAALGYLHVNCGHCHNQARPAWVDNTRCFDPMRDFDLSLRSTALDDVSETPVYQTALARFRGHMGGEAIMTMERGFMPMLGSEETDKDGVALLNRWAAKLSDP